MPEPLFEPEDLAKRWKVTLLTLAQWRWTGRGPRFFKAGRNTFYRVQDIEAYEEEKAQRSTSTSTNPNLNLRSYEEHHFEENLKNKLKLRRKRKR